MRNISQTLFLLPFTFLVGSCGVLIDPACFSPGIVCSLPSDNHSGSQSNGISLHGIQSIAGSLWGYSGSGQPPTAAHLYSPSGIVVAPSGDIFIVDSQNNVVRKVSVSNGEISTVAGSGSQGYAGDGGPATLAQLSHPAPVAIDGEGNLYIADEYNSVIRRVSGSNQVISTIAGTGVWGVSGDGGAATSATLTYPVGMALDSSGNLYFSDAPNAVIRKVDLTSGIISTFAGTGGSSGYSGDGGLATLAKLHEPEGIIFDSSDNLYIADSFNHVVRKVSKSTGIISTFAGMQYVGASESGDGGPATSAKMISPYGLALDSSENLYISDGSSIPVVRQVSGSTGIIETVAGNGGEGKSGDGGLAIDASFYGLMGLAVDANDNLYLADSGNDLIRKIAISTNIVTQFAGNGTSTYLGDGGPATAALLNGPTGFALDSNGNLYIADSQNNVVRLLNAQTGKISTVAGTGVGAYSGDGGQALAATLNFPTAVALDQHGDLYVSDTRNSVIRKVTTATGVISTFAGNGTSGFAGDGGLATNAEINYPTALAFDSANNLYFVDWNNNRIRKIAASTGKISTVVGNGTSGYSGDGASATNAQINIWGFSVETFAIAVDQNGNLYFPDTYNNVIRKVISSTGIISTVAGNGTSGFSGDGGGATSAQLNSPNSVAIDPAGNLYIADTFNNLIRKVNNSGTISTFAGQPGAHGSSVNGTLAAETLLNQPTTVMVDKNSNVYVSGELNVVSEILP